jgi:hypothetical protein
MRRFSYLESFKLPGSSDKFSQICIGFICKFISAPHSIIHFKTQKILVSSLLKSDCSKVSHNASFERLH